MPDDLLGSMINEPPQTAPGGDLLGQMINPAADQASALVRTSADDDPQKAAQAMQIGQALDTPAKIIQSDFDNFKKIHQVRTSTDLVGSSPELANYINSDPMAASVSKNDLPQIDAVQKAVKQFQSKSALAEAVKGFGEGFGSGGLGSTWLDVPTDPMERLKYVQDHPGWGAVAGALSLFGGIPETTLRIASGLTGALARGGAQLYENVTGDPSGHDVADTAVRALGDPGLWASLGPASEIGLPFEMLAHNAELRQAVRAATPFAAEGEVPPVGAHEVLDDAHREQAKQDADNLKDVIKEMRKSETLGLSPALAENAVRAANDGVIGINPDAVRELYGEKAPAPGDGLLGDVPDIEQQLQRGEQTGADVKVPLAQWVVLAAQNPDLEKLLGDQVRARPEGITNFEGEREPGIVAYQSPEQPITHPIDAPIQTIRSASKLDPIELDAPRVGGYSLQKTSETPADQFHHAEHTFNILDAEGKPAATLDISINEKGNAYIDMINAAKGVKLDPLALRRDLPPAVAEAFPQADKLEGEMVSGARLAAGKSLKVSYDLKKYRKATTKAVQLELPVEGTTRLEETPAFKGAFRGWMNKAQAERVDELLRKRTEEDQEAARAAIVRDERRKASAEWKARGEEIRGEVADAINARPDVRVDDMIQAGNLKLNPKGYEAYGKILPRGYFAKDGVDPDIVAGHFGFASGDALVEALADHVQQRRESGLNPSAYKRRLINKAIEGRLEQEYGAKEARVLEEARDRVLSETQEQILHERVLAAAEKVGAKFPILKAKFDEMIRDTFNATRLKYLSSKEEFANLARAGQAWLDAFSKGDAYEEFRQSQRQAMSFGMAKLSAQLDKAKAAFDKTAKGLRMPRDPKAKLPVPEDFLNEIHALFQRFGIPTGRSVQALAEARKGTLADFIDAKETEYSRFVPTGVELPIPEWLLNEGVSGNIEDLTAEQFMGLKRTVDMLKKLGRDESKWQRESDEFELKDLVSRLGQQAEDVAHKMRTYGLQKEGLLKRNIKQFFAGMTNIDTLARRLDRRDPQGIYTKTFAYPGAEAANHKDRIMREAARMYGKLAEDKIPNKRISVPFLDPLRADEANPDGRPYDNFTTHNLEAVIAYMGNEYNWNRMAYTLGMDPDLLMHWVEANSTPEMIDRAQARGDIFQWAKDQDDVVFRRIYGHAPEDIPVRPFTMHGKQYRGWYHPIIMDELRAKTDVAKGPDPTKTAVNFWPSVAAGYAKKRTGYTDRLSLNMDLMPVKLNQILHSIAFREYIYQTAKIVRNNDFRTAFKKWYSDTHLHELDTYLTEIAGNASFNSMASSDAARLSNFFRTNVIGTYIGFNPSTVEKHGLSAAIGSGQQVGYWRLLRTTSEVAADSAWHYLQAVTDLFGKSPHLGETLWQFVRRNSEEIQRRDRNFLDTIIGEHEYITGQNTLRKRIAQWGSKAVAMSDMISAVPTWLAAYRQAYAELGDHGPAVDVANMKVRLAHGSTAITNQPRLVRGGGALNPWLTSIYGYFGTQMQRRIEIAHDMNDIYHFVKGMELKSAGATATSMMGSVFAYVIWPTIVEEAVTSQFTDDKRGWGSHVLMALLGGVGSSFLYLRDLTYGMSHKRDPEVGLISSPLNDINALSRDLTKPHPLNKQNAGKLIQDLIVVGSDATGLSTKSLASVVRGGYNIARGVEHPHTAGDWFREFTRGTMKRRIER